MSHVAGCGDDAVASPKYELVAAVAANSGASASQAYAYAETGSFGLCEHAVPRIDTQYRANNTDTISSLRKRLMDDR